MTVAELTARISVIGDKQVKQSLENLKGAFRSTAMAVSALSAAVLAGATIMGVHAALAYDSQVRGLALYQKNAEDLTAQLARLKEMAKLPGLGLQEIRMGVLSLEATGFTAQMAEESIKQFGNALALAGRGKAELQGVILALSQISSKGKLAAQEVNQLAERVPQIRMILKSAFRTGDTEVIQKMGLSAEQAIKKIIDELSKLKRASGGAVNDFDNLKDSIDFALLPIGRGILDMFSASSNEIGSAVGKLQEFNTALGEVLSSVGRSGNLATMFKSMNDSLAGGGGMRENLAVILGMVTGFFTELPKLFSNMINGISDGVQGLKLAVTLMNADNPLSNIFDPAKHNKELETAQKAFDEFKKQAATRQVDVNFRRTMVNQGAAGAMSLKPQGLPANLNYGKANVPIPGGALPGSDGTKGGKDSLLHKIEKNTRKAADFLDLRSQSIGGGPLANLGLTGAEYAGMGMRPRESIKIRSPISPSTQIIRGLQDLMYGNMQFQTNGNAITKARF